MTGLRGRTGMALGAMMIMAGLAAPLAIATGGTPAAAAATQIQGTDVSGFTTGIDWPSVKAAGMTFAGVEAIQGKTKPNTQYSAQVTGATGQNLFVIPYVFADPGKLTASAQFTDAWAVINGSGVSYTRGGLLLPIALDLEYDSINFPGEPCYGLSPAAMVTWIENFVAAAKSETGAIPIIYSTAKWWAQCTGNTTALAADPLWVADYEVPSPALPPDWPGYTFWQSSNVATIGGISGHASDLDLMQGAPASLAAQPGTAGSFQVQSLNALAGQSVAYTATGLNTGLSLSSAGLFSWASTTPVGAYPITVTPTNPAVLPPSTSFTLKVHGAIAVASPGTRSTTAGTPVSLRVATSGPDQQAGFAPSLKATGLPAGLSISSAGLITGWPSKPGSYHVTVSASDGLGGSGSATFGWTVKAAGNAGFAGAIRQAGGSGKCVSDPGSSTKNGTLVNLVSCDGQSNQKWTVVQDGTIRVLGKCLDVTGGSKSNGARLQLWTCDSADGAQLWRAGTDGELVNPQSGKCVDVTVSSAPNNTRPVLWTCANVTTQPNEHWLRPAANVYSGEPGRCMAGSGAAIVLANCANAGAQHWTLKADGTLRQGSECLTEPAGATVRSELVLGSCSGAAASKWQLVSAGPIAVELAGAVPNLCVTSPSASAGARLILGSCAATPAATWRVG